MSTQVVTDVYRVGYVKVLSPQADQNGNLKYGVTLYVPKTETAELAKYQAAVKEATELGIATKWQGKAPNPVDVPIRDGDLNDRPESNGCWEVRCSSINRPGVVDADLNKVESSEEVYSGCYARLDLNFYPYAKSGNKGIAIGLNNFQKIKDGEKLAGGRSAESAFGVASPFAGTDAAATSAQASPFAAPAPAATAATASPFAAPAATPTPAAATPANPFGM